MSREKISLRGKVTARRKKNRLVLGNCLALFSTDFHATLSQTKVMLISTHLTPISEEPQLDYELSNKTVVEGSSVFWKCSAHARPNNILYHWTQNGRPVNNLEIGLRGHIQVSFFCRCRFNFFKT